MSRPVMGELNGKSRAVVGGHPEVHLDALSSVCGPALSLGLSQDGPRAVSLMPDNSGTKHGKVPLGKHQQLRRWNHE
jgi:hypothetical protein